MATWFLTNIDDVVPIGLTEVVRTPTFRLWGQPDSIVTARIDGEDVHFYLKGYILPRLGDDLPGSNAPGTSADRLLTELWSRHGPESIRHLKGIFTLLVVSRGVLHLFGDHSGFSRSFLWRNGRDLILTDSLREVANWIDPHVDFEAVAAHTLLHHYIGQTTFLRGVSTLPAAARVRFDGELQVDQYWSFGHLLDLPRRPVPYQDVADEVTRILRGYFRHLEPEGVSLTLTAGLDSRTVLAASLRNGVVPATYTYGDPSSLDVVTASRVAIALRLPHSNPRPEHKTPEWYDQLAWRIVESGSGLAHIHRAHRLDSVLRQPQLAHGRQMLLLGTMGGEGVRGAHLNDLIITEYVRRRWEGGVSHEELIDQIFERYFLRGTALDRDRLNALLDSLPLFSDDAKRNEFHAMYDLAGTLHHTQDIGLYSELVRYVVPLFMDVDYLELLFSTPYSMLSKRNMSSNQLDRLDIPAFSCNLIQCLHEPLARLPLGSGHTPADYLRSRLLYVIKKGLRKHLMPRPPANFPYGQWFRVFAERHLEEASQHSSLLNELFDLDAALAAVRNHDPLPGELHWHPFSNIVLHRMLERTCVRHNAVA